MTVETCNGRYILNAAGEPIPEPDLIKWAKWFEIFDRQLLITKISPVVTVSTVFLGLDHNFVPDGPPLLWETMIFGGERDQEMDRYTTREDAIKGHEKIVNELKGGSHHDRKG